MTGRPRLLLGALALALAATGLPLTGASGAGRPDPTALARQHLSGDASGSVEVVGDRSGRVGFVGTRAGVEIHNPDVRRGASVAQAARAHLDRYGALLGASSATTYVQRSSRRSRSSTDVVTYTQQVGGVPVLGGAVVVSMGPDRGLRSVQSTVSGVGSVQAPTVVEAQAAATARGLAARDTHASGLHVTAEGRWVLDPQVLGVPLPSGARTVWRFEVGDGAGIRQQVLVDDHTGQVLLHQDLIERADRVVCDDSNVPSAEDTCTTGFARTETSGSSTVQDVNDAFDHALEVSDFYAAVSGGQIDLTQMLGVDVSGSRKLAATVRFCTTYTGDDCPYANAFWNGTQMFYGQGFASADDVVGHEMTHGVVDQYSQLFYWGQSGAINESLADTMGEIVDHRNGTDDDSAWNLGEDLPGGPLRSMKDPTIHGQPDRMTSPYYTADSNYQDNGGVHTNSGVGNKTAYLISQGGTFNGQTITGIDAGDPTLAKTATLYLDVIERLPSGADYAALAAQLDQSCQDLVTSGTAGFTSTDCTAVHRAGLATELTSPPANVPTTTPADTTCPPGSTKRVLLDSETDPAAFAPVTSGWTRATAAGKSNATSGTESWYAEDPGSSTPSPSSIQTNSLRSNAPVALPAGQQSYLSYSGWYLFDYDPGYFDGGTVELGVDGAVPALGSTEGASFVNGPGDTLATGYGNSGAGHPAYGGDSHGWVVSRLDLTPDAGHAVSPQFTMRSDDEIGAIGWYLDDITVYTCDGSTLPPPPPPPAAPSAPQAVVARGGLDAMTVSWAAPAVNAAGVTAYRVSLGGVDVATVPGSATSVTLGSLPSAPAFAVTVWALGPPGSAAAGASVTVPRGYASARARRHGARLAVSGSVAAGGAPVGGALVQLQRQTRSGWLTVRTATARSDGHFVTTVRRRHAASYRVVFPGSAGAVGTASAPHRW